jgi:chromosome segregation ATPase
MEVSHANEIKAHEIEEGRLKERLQSAENENSKVTTDLESVKKELETKIGLLAVAEEKAKPAIELKGRLDAAELKISEYFVDFQKLNNDLLDENREKTELKLKILSLEKSPPRPKPK